MAQCVVARLPSSNPVAAVNPTPEQTLAIAVPRLCQRSSHGTTFRLRCKTLSKPTPVEGIKIRSLLRTSFSAYSGCSLSGPSHCTARPSTEAVVTRKRGSARLPVSWFHKLPAFRKTSTGPTAVEGKVSFKKRMVISRMSGSNLVGVKAYVECHIRHLVARPFCFYSGILGKEVGRKRKRLNMVSAREEINASRKQILEWCGCEPDAGNDRGGSSEAGAGKVHVSGSQPLVGRSGEPDGNAGLQRWRRGDEAFFRLHARR